MRLHFHPGFVFRESIWAAWLGHVTLHPLDSSTTKGRANSAKKSRGRETKEGNGESWAGKNRFPLENFVFTYLCGFDLSFSPNKSGQSSHVDEILGPGQDFEGPSSAWPGYLYKPESCLSFSENLPRLLWEDCPTLKSLQTRQFSLPGWYWIFDNQHTMGTG